MQRQQSRKDTYLTISSSKIFVCKFFINSIVHPLHLWAHVWARQFLYDKCVRSVSIFNAHIDCGCLPSTSVLYFQCSVLTATDLSRPRELHLSQTWRKRSRAASRGPARSRSSWHAWATPSAWATYGAFPTYVTRYNY